MEWLDRPKAERADFATLYFEDVDSIGHRHGPNSNEVNIALSQVDKAIQQLISGLKDAGLFDQTTLVIVSDHGMAEVPSENQIQLNNLLSNFSQYSVEWQGPLAGINLNGDPEDLLIRSLKQNTHIKCWPKREIPAKYHFGTHPRIPDVVCLADMGWTITQGLSLFNIPGQHGYDPELKEMHGIFIASGFKIRKAQLNTVENIEVYPFLCHLLGIKSEKNDAKDVLFKKIIQ
jgi:predicted AlkP superfamily pyrophosphatase or phosphodiesterase